MGLNLVSILLKIVKKPNQTHPTPLPAKRPFINSMHLTKCGHNFGDVG